MHHHPHFLFLLRLAFLALPLLTPAFSYKTLSINTSGNTTTVTISNPPINIYDAVFSADLLAFLSSLDPANRTSPPPKVVIFRSADPEFFIGHLDLNALVPPLTLEKLGFVSELVTELSLLRGLTTTVFIAEINGKALGAGHELIMQMDMRFAGPNARAGSLETSLGLLEGAGGMQFLGRLINKGRALQYLLSGDTADCKTGKELGWFNDCYGSSDELEEKVGALAWKIAQRPAGGLNATKAALQSLNPTPSVLAGDVAAFSALIGSPEAQQLVAKFLLLGKNQTRSPFELGLDDSLAQLYQ